MFRNHRFNGVILCSGVLFITVMNVWLIQISRYRTYHGDLRHTDAYIGFSSQVMPPDMLEVNGNSGSGKRCPTIKCKNFAMTASHGKWVKRQISISEKVEMARHRAAVYKRFKLPDTGFFREDELCGNVTVGSFRALCDPDGDNPCCYDNRCIKRSTKECQCHHCYDLRTKLHADISTWVPDNPSCHPEEMTPTEMCDILNGKSFTFFGDSIVRHVYTAFLMLVTGDMNAGALGATTPKHMRAKCKKMSMISDIQCQHYLAKSTSLCNNSVVVEYVKELKASEATPDKLRTIVESHHGNHHLLLSLGIHHNYNFSVVKSLVLEPLLKICEKRLNIHWLLNHKPGLEKSPNFDSQNWKSVINFNTDVGGYLMKRGVSVLNFYNMTETAYSFDGTHYSLAVNMLKAMIIMQKMKHLQCEDGLTRKNIRSV